MRIAIRTHEGGRKLERVARAKRVEPEEAFGGLSESAGRRDLGPGSGKRGELVERRTRPLVVKLPVTLEARHGGSDLDAGSPPGHDLGISLEFGSD